VLFCGCSFELTHGGCQYWVSKAMVLLSTNEGGMKMMSTIRRHVASGTKCFVKQCVLQEGARAGLFIV
jgi:hypothetical protein